MMNSRIICGWGFILLCLLGGCIPDPLPVDTIAKPETKIVVSSQIVPNVGLVVLVTKSISALDAGKGTDPQLLLEQIVISDATVTLNHNNQTDVLRNLGSGLYGGLSLEWVPGRSYELQVATSSLGKVSAITQVAQRVPFASVEANLYRMGIDTLAQVAYSLHDPVGKNYYMVNVQRFSRKQDIGSLLNPRVFTRLITDETFDGQQFDESFKTLFQRYSKGDSIAVVMSNVSEDYYAFLKIRNDRFRFSDFASEPMNYPSNVKGGYGYFNLHVPDVRVFVLE